MLRFFLAPDIRLIGSKVRRASSGVLLVVLFGLPVPSRAQKLAGSSVSHLKQEAEKAYAEGNTDQALSLYGAALAKAPEWAEGWWRYGGLLYDGRRFSEAAEAFGHLIRLAPENPLGFALLGLCEYEQQDWDNAAVHLQRALAARSGLSEAIYEASAYHLGLVIMHDGNAAEAFATLKQLFHRAPKYPELLAALGAAQLNLREIPTPGSPLARAVNMAGQAAVAVLEDRKIDADEAYQSLLGEFPNQPFAHLDYGILLESQNRDKDAVAEFVAETKANPRSATAWLWLGRVALDRENALNARTYALRAQTLDPNEPLSYLIEGRSYMLEHQPEWALMPLREAEKRAPQSSEVHYALASVYAALNKKVQAEEERQLFLEASKAEQAQQ